MESPAVFVFILAAITFEAAPAYTQSIFASENPLPVGSQVTMYSPTTVITGAWISKNELLVLIFPGQAIIADPFKDRVTFNSTTNFTSLTIRSLMVKDSGLYTLQALNMFTAMLTLSVQEPISNVTLRAKATHLVEFNDTAVLTCSVSTGTSLSYVWLNGSYVVNTSEGIQLSDGGATLTIASVTRYDEGPFRCNVSNGVSNGISPPANLNISYGPSNTAIMVMPMKHVYRTGSNITLSCSAESWPPAAIHWMVDGVHLTESAPQLHLNNVTEGNSGNYQCSFHNAVTLRFSSASATIRIVEPITAVMVNHTGRPAILHELFTMHCEVTGPVDKIQWWKNGQLISTDNTTFFDMGNKTLMLNPVQDSDNGDYQCWAFNSVSNMTSSPYTVVVYYGPKKPVIMGPTEALTGTQVRLNCSSDSHPPSHIKWYFNHSPVATTSELMIGPLTLNMSGKYICMAFNNITEKNSTAYVMLTVLVPVTMASVEMVGAQPILNHTFTLTCETTGTVGYIIWMHGPSQLYPDSTRSLSMDNATLTFGPVMGSDNGEYRCVASNPLSSFTSDIFTLDIIYGPKMPTIMGPNMATEGDIVTLSCKASSNPPSTYQWYFDDHMVANTSYYVTPPFTGNMSGMYTCMAFNNVTGKNSTAYTILTFIDQIIDVQVEAPVDRAIEGHYYNLTCNVTGPAQYVYWMKNGEALHGDSRTVFYMQNRTVAFKPIKYNDTGSYQCIAINIDGNMTSPPYELCVNFGPKTPVIHGPAFGEIGRYAVFNCSAKSLPPSKFSWWYNGSEVANTSVFTAGPLSFNMSGEYTCVAYNRVTGKNSTSSTMLTVIEAIESVMVSNSTVPIDSENFTLTCEVVGPYDKIYWMKDNMLLNHHDNVTTNATTPYHIENNTLSFTPVTTYNDGKYQCAAINRAGPHASAPFMLLVNYGPLKVTIFGPDSAVLNSPVSLTCVADSRPESAFYWFLNNQSSPLQAGSVFTFHAMKKYEGNYTCKAKNPVTNITMYQTKAFTVDHASALNSPSRGGLMLMGVFALSFTVLFN